MCLLMIYISPRCRTHRAQSKSNAESVMLMVAAFSGRASPHPVDLLRQPIREAMERDLRWLTNYRFIEKPLIFGGAAMQYYGLKQHGTRPIDLLLPCRDFDRLGTAAGLMRPERRMYLKIEGDTLGQHFCTSRFRFHNAYAYQTYEDFIDRCEEYPTYRLVSIAMLQQMLSLREPLTPSRIDDLECVINYRLQQDRMFPARQGQGQRSPWRVILNPLAHRIF